jgi:hypothetical protein
VAEEALSLTEAVLLSIEIRKSHRSMWVVPTFSVLPISRPCGKDKICERTYHRALEPRPLNRNNNCSLPIPPLLSSFSLRPIERVSPLLVSCDSIDIPLDHLVDWDHIAHLA